MLPRDTLEKLEEMSQPTVMEIKDNSYIIRADGFTQIREEIDTPDTLTLYSLEALVFLVKTEALALLDKAPVYIEAIAHDQVSCFLPISASGRYYRALLYTSVAKDVPGWNVDKELPYEEALIAVRTRFQQSPDTEYLLRLLSEVSNGAKVTFANNGIATTVITQKGVALQSGEAIKPIVSLRPYRTFQEIAQPASEFHIRISERGIRFIEADGGMWKLNARADIVNFLRCRFEDEGERVYVVL
jgi:hypothetical protein